MRRGTRVGQAYVALAVDGSNVNEEIVEAFDNVDYKGLGERHGKQYSKNLQKHMEKDLSKALKNSMRNMSKAIETDDTMRKSVERMVSLVERDDSINNLYRHIAKQAGVEFEGEFEKTIKNSVRKGLHRSLLNAARSGKTKDLLRALVSSVGLDDGKGSMLLPGIDVEGMAADLKKELDKAGFEWESMLNDAHKMNQRFNENRSREHEETLQRMLRAQERFLEEEAKAKAKADLAAAKSDKERFVARQRLISETLKVVEKRAKEEEKILNKIHALSKKFTERDGEARKKVEREVALVAKLGADEREEAYKRIHETAEKYHKDLVAWRKEETRLTNEYNRANRDSERVSRNRDRDRDRNILPAAALGAVFGAGARNNFLNIIGRTLTNTLGLVNSLGKGVTSLSKTFMSGFNSISSSASGLQKAMAGMGSVGSASLGSLARGGPAAAAALVVVVAVMSVMVSVASALVAIVVALAATIASALTGAMLVLGGAIMGVVAAGGLLVAAFTSMTDAQAAMLKNAFTPLKEAFTGLGQIVLQDLVPAFATWSANLQQAVLLAVPAAQAMGSAFAEAGNIITASLSGPGFQRFADAMAVYLPGIVTNLSRAFGNFMNGLMGLFSALMPFVLRFSEYLSRVTQRFSEWANSAQGQNSIVDFANRAWEAIKSLWNFTREFFGWLFDLLFSPAAQEAGNGLFDSLARSFEGFRRAIANGDLERWFSDAIAFAGDLKQAVIGVKDMFLALNNSGVLNAVGNAIAFVGEGFSFLARILESQVVTVWLEASARGFEWVWRAASWVFDLFLQFNSFVLNVSGILGPLGTVVDVLKTIADAARDAADWLNKIPGVNIGGGDYKWGASDPSGMPMPASPTLLGNGLGLGARAAQSTNLPSLINVGRSALNRTSESRGGYLPDPQTPKKGAIEVPKYVNPYKAWAESLIKDGPSIAAQIRQALRKMEKDASKAIMDASKATDASSVRSSLKTMAKGMRDEGKSLVGAAQSALNSAAQSLASASSPEAAAKALKEVKKAQRGLQQALKAQKNLQKTAKTIASQRVVTSSNVNKLMQGLNVRSATLADYAKAQERIAKRLEKANEQLANAVAMRDDYRNAVTDSIKQFGSLLSAEASVVDGIEQALSSQDVTGNLQDRLTQIKNFQDNLRILLARGLSDAAYKQIVDGGVEQGGAIAEALVAGGVGAVDQTNQLVGQINSIANSLGLETSNHLYQAGVDVAQGLVDGLNSLSDDLEFAANQLGIKIANALKRSLGIKSPSTVMIAAMSDVGDGIVAGLDNQHNKVIGASSSLAGAIAVSPEVAMWEARMRANGGVSGNSRTVGDITVITPTEDPAAVAHEVVNEIVGRL